MKYGYPRTRRITQRAELVGISAKGERVRTSDLDVRWLASPFGFLRVGIIVPRYRHTAVERNRLKRRLRELVRTILLPMEASRDVVLRCRPGAYDRTFEELKDRIQKIRLVLAQIERKQ